MPKAHKKLFVYMFTYEELTMTIDQTKLLQLTNCKSPMPGTIYSTASSGLLQIDKILQQMLWKLSSPSPVKKKTREKSPASTYSVLFYKVPQVKMKISNELG